MNRSTRAALMMFIGLSAGAVLANDVPAAPLQQTVHFAQLDLTQPAAAEQLYRKLMSSAKQVCEPVNGGLVRQKFEYRSCVTETLANAVEDVNQPLLTNVYGAKGGRSIAALKVATK